MLIPAFKASTLKSGVITPIFSGKNPTEDLEIIFGLKGSIYFE
jgi:hypothetical protein